jgi:4-hydroxy-3-methylbut-2-enyl diphosphate reductase
MTKKIEMADELEFVAEGGLTEGSTTEYDNLWKRLNGYLESKERITVLVTNANRGGLIVGMGAVAFIPKANLSAKIANNLNDYIGQSLVVKVVEVDQEKDRVVLSEKIVTDEDNKIKRDEALKNLKVGQTTVGTVKRLADFGAFVDLGGIDGLLHISDMSWEHISSPEDVVTVDDDIEVKILRIEDNGKKIALGLKQLSENPWQVYKREAKVGDIIECTVAKIENFGVVVNIKQAIDGIISLRDLTDKRIESANGVVEIGDKLIAKITDFSAKDRKLTLSVRDAKRDSEYAEFKAYMKEQSDRTKEATPTLGDIFGDLFDKMNKE